MAQGLCEPGEAAVRLRAQGEIFGRHIHEGSCKRGGWSSGKRTGTRFTRTGRRAASGYRPRKSRSANNNPISPTAVLPRFIRISIPCESFTSVPEVNGVAELDADLFAAFGVAEAVNDLGLGAGAFVLAAEDYRAAFLDRAAAEEGGAVAADAYRPGLLVPSLVRIFATQPDRDGGNAARAAPDVLGKLRDAKKKIQQAGFGVRLGEAGICGEFFGLLGTVHDESFELVRGGGVERKIPEAFVARFQFRYACGEKVFEAQPTSVEVNRGGSIAGGAGATAGLEEQVHIG